MADDAGQTEREEGSPTPCPRRARGMAEASSLAVGVRAADLSRGGSLRLSIPTDGKARLSGVGLSLCSEARSLLLGPGPVHRGGGGEAKGRFQVWLSQASALSGTCASLFPEMGKGSPGSKATLLSGTGSDAPAGESQE